MLLFFLATLPFSSSFLEKYPLPTYQDIIVQNQVIAQGTNICATRYELIRPLLDELPESFTLLEIGAAQGYFSFRIAHDFPLSSCTMIEENNSHYSFHGTLLEELCDLNSNLENIYFIKKRITTDFLRRLNTQAHYDVILFFLVMHQMECQLAAQISLFKTLLKMGNYLILELSGDTTPKFLRYIENLIQKSEGRYLGELKRYYDPKLLQTGKFYLFRPPSH